MKKNLDTQPECRRREKANSLLRSSHEQISITSRTDTKNSHCKQTAVLHQEKKTSHKYWNKLFSMEILCSFPNKVILPFQHVMHVWLNFVMILCIIFCYPLKNVELRRELLGTDLSKASATVQIIVWEVGLERGQIVQQKSIRFLKQQNRKWVP